jgi:predicted nucleic acid-binding protein
VLPDFFIGAHAVIADTLLITRDAARHRSYFPGIMLIAPD